MLPVLHCAARFLTRRSRSVCSECLRAVSPERGGSRGWIRATVLWLAILELGDSRGLSELGDPAGLWELGDSAGLWELGDSGSGTVNTDHRCATMCECAHSFAQRFLISKRLRCTRHEDEMLWSVLYSVLVLGSMVRIMLTPTLFLFDPRQSQKKRRDA